MKRRTIYFCLIIFVICIPTTIAHAAATITINVYGTTGGTQWIAEIYPEVGTKSTCTPFKVSFDHLSCTISLAPAKYKIGIGTQYPDKGPITWTTLSLYKNSPINFYVISGTVSENDQFEAQLFQIGTQPQLLAQVPTLPSNSYSFLPVPVGQYRIGLVNNERRTPTSFVLVDLSLPGKFSAANFYSLSARVLSGSSGVVGIPLTLTCASNCSMMKATTDEGGITKFLGLAANSTYTVSPPLSSEKMGAYDPESKSAPLTNSSASVEFWTTFSIGGRVSAGSRGMSGVTITLTGSDRKEMKTGSDGRYSFDKLIQGAYKVTVTPPAGWRAAKSSISVQVGPKDSTDANFAIAQITNVPFVYKPDNLLLYKSSFSTDETGWTAFSTGGVGLAGVNTAQGKYSLYLPDPGKLAYAVAPVAASAFSSKGYSLQAKVNLDAAVDSKIGLLFDWVSVDEFSVVMIRPKLGVCQIYHYANGYSLLPGVTTCTINNGALENTVKLVRDLSAGKLELYVNGTMVNSPAYNFPIGRPGFAFMSYTDAPVKGWFDDFEIRNLP